MTLANKCPYDVWMHWNSIDPKWDGLLHKITSTSETHNLGDHPFSGNFMLSRTAADGNVSKPMSQVEYNFRFANLIYYDLSNKDALPGTVPPFMAGGIQLTVSGGTGNDAVGKITCQNIHCPPSQDPCSVAYLPASTLPQNEKDWSCGPDVNFSFVACSG